MISWIEILLLIVGAGLFVVSFLVPEKEEKVSKETRMMAREEIRDLVSKEMENIRGHVDDVVEESMTYAMEKTERSLERLSNEKIMAVNEYSELVLKEINKNHDEVMFLYDMLNDKHSNLKNTVNEATKAAKEVEETTKEAEAVVDAIQKLAAEPAQEEFREWDFAASGGREQTNAPEQGKVEAEAQPEEKKTEPGSKDRNRNRNDAILSMYRQGYPILDIAQFLGVGTGEVKLVIDLYKDK